MQVAFAFIVVIAVWSTTPLAIQWSIRGVDLEAALALRMFIGAALSALWLRVLGGRLPLSPAALKLYAVSLPGLVGAMSTIYWSAQFIASGLISVLFGLAPIFGGFYARLWLGEAFFTPRRLAGTVCGLVGLALIFHQELHFGEDGWKGVAGLLLAVNLYALSAVWIKRLGGEFSAVTVNTGSLLASLPLFAVLWAVGGAPWPHSPDPRALAAIVYLGVFGSFVGFVAYYYVLRRLQTASVLLITLITPVIALILGAVLNGERLESGAVAGAALVIGGLVIYQWPAIGRFATGLSVNRRSPT